jgi:hypothetical protein
MKPLEICATGTGPKQPVIVAAQGSVSLSQTVDTPIASPAFKGDWTNILAAGYTHGASGGGLFDAAKGCLAGIIIIEATAPGIAFTQFVPAPQIATFLAGKR